MDIDPAFLGSLLRPLFWVLVLAGVALVFKFLPLKVRRFFSQRLL